MKVCILIQRSNCIARCVWSGSILFVFTQHYFDKKTSSKIDLFQGTGVGGGWGGDSGWFLKGFNLIKLPYLLYVFGQTSLSKQCRPPDQTPRSAASDLGIYCLPLSQQFLHTFPRSKMDLLKRSIRFCLCWSFTTQSTKQGHVERGQFT